MLNIFNLRLKYNKAIQEDNKAIQDEKKANDLGQTRHYPPASQEWFNSIYAYNKNTTKLLPIADIVIIKLIKSYFHLYSRKLERKIKSRRLRIRFRRLSTNRILVSRAELKHTSEKVIVTLYVYNRQKIYYLNKIKKIATPGFLAKRHFKSKMRLIKIQGLRVISKVRKEKDLLLKTLRWEKANFKYYEITYYKNYIIKSLEKEMLYMYLKQIISFNKSKFENTYLLPFKSLIEKVYNKKVEFNLVNLKYLHLNSDIFTEILAKKLRNRKNRVLRVLRTSLRQIKLPSLNKLAILEEFYNRKKKLKNFSVNFLASDSLFFKPEIQNKDTLDQIIENFIKINFKNEFPNNLENVKDKSLNHLENNVLNSIKHKIFSGIRIQASGRLTRRIIAARSILKFKYLGNLKNLDSSYKQFSSVLLRGHFKSNLQHTKLKSKTRIGSFGLKGWVSSI